jgi:membrane protein DedA with SNARE-associated domain
MQEYLSLLLSGVESVGIWFIVPFLALENIPIIGLFVPGLTVLVLSGFFYELLTGVVWKLYILAWLTIFLADSTMYLVGYFGQQKTKWLQTLSAQAPDVGELLHSQPKWALLNYQFIPYFRMFLPFALGLYRFSPVWWFPLS